MNHQNILIELNNILNKTDRLYCEISKSLELSDNQGLILYYLFNHKNCTQNELKNEIALPKQTINTILSKWIKDGYIDLVKTNRREKIIEFTEYGNDVLLPKAIRMQKLELKALSLMNDDEINSMLKANLKYYQKLKEILDYED